MFSVDGGCSKDACHPTQGSFFIIGRLDKHATRVFGQLSHQASSELVKYDNFLKGEGDSGPSQITLWFEMARLCSWQEIVGTAGPSTWNSFSSVRGFVDVNTAQTLVFAVYTLTKVQRGRLSTTMKLRGQTGEAHSSASSLPGETDRTCTKAFLFLLPTRLQKRADNWWTQRLLDKSAEEDLTDL
ncbi:unnamed protein product [Alternaria alternata]